MKKGKKNQKNKIEEKNNTRMSSLKGFMKKSENKTQTWLFEIKVKKKTTKKNKSKWRILKQAVSGESNSQKINPNRVPLSNVFLARPLRSTHIWTLKPKIPKNFELRFCTKNGNSLKVIRPKKGKLIKASFHLIPN